MIHVNPDALSASTHTCTMIPFELYSLRRASEKWLSNLWRRVETSGYQNASLEFGS